VKELKGFSKVELKPGEEKEVSISLDFRAFAYWDGKWRVTRAPTGFWLDRPAGTSAFVPIFPLTVMDPFRWWSVGPRRCVMCLESDEAVPAFRGMMEQVLKMVGNETNVPRDVAGFSVAQPAEFPPGQLPTDSAMLGRRGDA
jgi:hypothetical protein